MYENMVLISDAHKKSPNKSDLKAPVVGLEPTT